MTARHIAFRRPGGEQLPADGKNTTLCSDINGREEADRLYSAPCEGGSEGSPMADMPWDGYWGFILDC